MALAFILNFEKALDMPKIWQKMKKILLNRENLKPRCRSGTRSVTIIKDDDGVGDLIFLEHCHTQMSSLEIFLIKVYVVQ